jgi:SAM-dependent methyltransferase
VFIRRADSALANPTGLSYQRAHEAIAGRGTVLDVGCGAGTASLPLGQAIIGVDISERMLAELRHKAEQAGLSVTTIQGRWPDVAAQAPVADVVVCHHVVYNVPDLAEFAVALDRHASRRVVIELSASHPTAPLNPLWKALHGLTRPTRPTADDAIAVLREAGIDANRELGPRPPRPEYDDFDELIAVTRRRLCLTPDRDGDLRIELLRLGVDPRHPRDLPGPDRDTVVTLWWDCGTRA